eukprot:1332660-Amorphochlora_amoeboformis.AAC.2
MAGEFAIFVYNHNQNKFEHFPRPDRLHTHDTWHGSLSEEDLVANMSALNPDMGILVTTQLYMFNS